jgi:hypothetical protein
MKDLSGYFYTVLLLAWDSEGPGSMWSQVKNSVKTRIHNGHDGTKQEIFIYLN